MSLTKYIYGSLLYLQSMTEALENEVKSKVSIKVCKITLQWEILPVFFVLVILKKYF